METEGGFARPRPPLDEVSAVGGVTAGQDVVEEPQLRWGQRHRRRWPAWLALPGGSDVWLGPDERSTRTSSPPSGVHVASLLMPQPSALGSTRVSQRRGRLARSAPSSGATLSSRALRPVSDRPLPGATCLARDAAALEASRAGTGLGLKYRVLQQALAGDALGQALSPRTDQCGARSRGPR